jgi:hypothetical protein
MPLDAVKSYVQTKPNCADKGFLEIIRLIIAEGGVHKLYKVSYPSHFKISHHRFQS